MTHIATLQHFPNKEFVEFYEEQLRNWSSLVSNTLFS